MAQTTAATFDTEKARDPQVPIMLLTLELTGATTYLANRAVTVGGQAYTEQIAEGVEVELDGSFDASGDGTPRVGTVEVALNNADDGGAPFSDILATRTLTNRRAILRQEYLNAAGNPLALADCLTLMDGTIRLPEDSLFDDQTMRIEIADGSPAWHKELGSPITLTDFAGAAPDVIGQIQPIVYGAISKHKCIPVDIGGRTTLREDLAAGAATVKVTDASVLPASGSIYIDGDEIAYTGKSTNDLTGASGVDASHDRGAAVVEKQAAYDYLVAGHACKTISAVYIRVRGGGPSDWMLVPAAEYTAYATGGGGYAGKANVRFSAATFLQRAVDLSVASHGHAASGAHDHDVTTEVHQLGSGSYPEHLTTYRDFAFTNVAGDSACIWKVVISAFSIPAGVSNYIEYGPPGGPAWEVWHEGDTVPGTWVYSGGVGTDTFQMYPHGTATIDVLEVSRDVTCTDATAGETATVEDATAAVSGQQVAEAIYDLEVAVDVEGYADDGGGTYTGTASALIIRPADQLRHIGCVLLGWTMATRFDATTFDAARTAEAAAGMRLDFAITQAIDSAELFERIRHQSMSAHLLTGEGKYKRFVSPFSATSLKTFTEADDLVDVIRVGLTPQSELYNVVGLRYAPDPWTGEPTAYTEATSPVSQGTGNPPTPGYNVTTRWLQTFDLLRDADAAVWARDEWLDWLQDQRFTVELAARPEWIHVEPWDKVAVTSTRMPGDWTAKTFHVQRARKLLGRKAVSPGGAEAGDPASVDDRILLACREVREPLLTGAVTLENMRLSLLTDTAFAILNGVDLSPYADGLHPITIWDSAGKRLKGWLKAPGGGLALGPELVDGWTNHVSYPWDTWTPGAGSDVTQAAKTGTAHAEIAYKAVAGVSGTLYCMVRTVTLASGVQPLWYFGTGAGLGAPAVAFRTGSGTVYRTAAAAYTHLGFWQVTASLADLALSGFSFKAVTAPPATGATIVSAAAGASYNWAHEQTGFNRSDTSGYTYAVY